MIDERVITWNINNFEELYNFLGERPGNKTFEPYYLKRGMGSKLYCWDDLANRWRLVNPGDRFYKREDGSVVQEKAVRV